MRLVNTGVRLGERGDGPVGFEPELPPTIYWETPLLLLVQFTFQPWLIFFLI